MHKQQFIQSEGKINIIKSLLVIFLIFTIFNVNGHCEKKLGIKEGTFSFVVMHTDDMHSHFEGSGPDGSLVGRSSIENGNNRVIGHYARLLNLIRKVKSQFKHNLLLDAGDWMMGTLFHTLSMSSILPQIAPPELEFFRLAKYDAVILGNHEFDVFQDGFLSILRKMNEQKGDLNYTIPIVSSNLNVERKKDVCGRIWNELYETEPLNVIPDEEIKRKGVFMVPHFTKTFRNENGTELTVGVIGTMGPASAMVSIAGRQPCFHFHGFNESTYKAELEEYSKHIHSLALDLKLGKKNSPKCDVVIVLSHSGEPEDKKVAELIVKRHEEISQVYNKKLPKVAVDLHISSHTHNIYLEKIKIDSSHSVYIHQSGPYASNLGVLQLQYNFETQQVILENEKVKVPLSNIVGDAVDREKYEYDHQGPLSASPSLFETCGICFDCINGKSLLPLRIPLTNEIPMDQNYRNQIEYYKKLINKYILGDSFKFKYETSLGQVRVSKVGEKSKLGTVLSDLIYSELLSKQKEAINLISFLKNQTSFNSHATISENLEKLDDSSMKVPPHHTSYKNWKVSDVENVLLNNRFHMYWIPTDGIRTHINSLKHWNESVLDLQFSDAYTMLSLGRLKPSVREGSLPGESMEVYYLSHRDSKRVFIYSKVLSDVLKVYILSYCHSSSFSYKTRWWGIPLLIEDKIHKKEESQLTWFQKVFRKIKNSLARYYDFTINGIPENEYYDQFYAKPHQSIYSPEPLYGLVIPGWVIKFVSQTSALSNGWLNVELRDRYGRIINYRRDAVKLAKHETRVLTSTTQNSIPFMDYELFAESLSKINLFL